ncbi:diguanylate cyclase domain-containing protein [Candidatus Neptunichlamydia sp. REUL1]|uniref:diguanylate cyclase domain-containing protein n=1 Tax=Candidatus Neptunichlamydia sp. REUL1 TaxID=3064277 RepID=UPI00292D2984|nr:diguanylate cyclase [Candidatus Neptunochlamydia sp. REUL1]
MAIKPKKLPTLLLLTDNPLMRAFFEGVIAKIEAHALIIASSKLEALEYLDRTYISIIVVDEKIPNLALIPLCTDIRTLKDYAHTPILIITAHLKKSFIRNLIKAGATDFLREPLEEDEFLLRMEMAGGVMETQAKMATLSSCMSKDAPSNASLEHRAVLGDRATKLVGQALSEKTQLALLLLEIDQYPQIVETRGENVAHALTLDFEDHLQKLIRSQDLLYNQNHGKFAVFLPKTSCKAAVFIAENISEYLDSEIFSAGNIRFTLTVSIGVASLDQAGDATKSAAINLERLSSCASQCLKKANEKKDTIVSEPPKTGDNP